MIRGFYTAGSGLKAHQAHMDTISNNLANVNTVGFKGMRTAFKDLIYQNINRDEVENEAIIGHGVKVNKNDVMMNVGAFDQTGRLLDFAITVENGFFAVQDDMDEIYYTRAGNFYLSNEDDTYYLVTANGDRVLDEDLGEIEIEFDDWNNIDPSYALPGVFSFPNPYGLSLEGGLRFVETEMSGEAEAIEEPPLKVQYLEKSGVNIATEMANVVEASKAFSFAARMVQTADEVEQTINSLR